MELKEIVKYFRKLNLNGKTEEKNGLTYLSWSWALEEALRVDENLTYEVVKQEGGKPYLYDDSLGYMVFTKVTMKGVTRECWLPVLDGANKPMKAIDYTYKVKDWNKSRATGQTVLMDKDCKAANMFDINTTIMRCLVKNLAMFGLGLYIYHGEANPEAPKTLTDERFKEAMTALDKNLTTRGAIERFDLTDAQQKELDDKKTTAELLRGTVSK